MDKSTKYRRDLREHFVESRHVVTKRDKKADRIPMEEDRPRREKFNYSENINRISTTETFPPELSNDNIVDHINCQSCRRGYRSPADPVPAPAPAPLRLSRTYMDYPCHQPEQNPYSHDTRKTTQANRNLNTHNRDPEPGTNKDDRARDWLLYKNRTFREPSSSRIMEDQQGEPVHSNVYTNKLNEAKNSKNYYENARAYCSLSNEKFRPKYNPLSEDSSSSKKISGNTIISAKNGKALKTIICSQIQVQQALDQHLKRRDVGIGKEAYQLLVDDEESDKVSVLKGSGPDKGIARSKPKDPKGKYEDIANFSIEPELDKLSPMEFRSSMFSVSADDIVSSKVIDPMIRKIQRMYLNTLREEMTIMEYLGKVPQMVSEVYREAAVRDQRKSSSDHK